MVNMRTIGLLNQNHNKSIKTYNYETKNLFKIKKESC